jgi:hypothetical protein
MDDGDLRIDEPKVEVTLKHNQDPLDAWIDGHSIRRLTVQYTRAAPEDATRNEGALKKITTFHIVSTSSPRRLSRRGNAMLAPVVKVCKT